ncbi:unnamed protein product [Prorocentrum cordatum]|uniref:Uncharacterized protein n=1 Tax=Prorocentrum cordatum TaxID=2364126 RepID=A0ABN9U3Z6_9DINO|nr:unnamed protein product [Polarella glacialis]
MSGDVGIHTAPGYGGLLVRTIRSDQIAFPDWAIEGPRTTLWRCRWIDRRGGGPLDHHRFFVVVHRLHKDSWGVPMHEFGMKALETLGAYDSLDLPNVAGIESLMREVQLVEHAHAKRDGFAGASTEVADGDLNAKKKGRGHGRGRGGAAGAFGYLDEHTAFRGQRALRELRVNPGYSVTSSPVVLISEASINRAGEHFDEPPHVDLATGSAFSALEVDGGGPIYVGETDIENAFYGIQLPLEFWQFFGLPRVRAGVRGITTDSAGGPLRASDWVTPCFTAVPMGWKHSLWICQRIMEFRARTNTLASPSLAFDDAHLPVRLVRSSTQVLHTEYVDSFVALGLSKDPTHAVTDSVDRSLRDAGFRTRGPTVSAGGGVLGWTFDQDAPTIGISHRIGWRIRLGCLAVADMKYASGDLVRVVVSHFTSRALLRRELLSCLQASYSSIESSGHHTRVLWSSVKRELRWCAALIALAFRDVNAAWPPMVYCTDASWWGAGVVRGIRSVQEVQHVGHYTERLRYSAAHEAILKPRDSALKCSVSGGVTASPQDSEIPKAPFPEVLESVYGGDWSLVMSQKWSRKEAQVVLEARSLVLTVKNIVRNTQNFGCKHLLAPRPLGGHAGGLPRAEVAPNLPAPSSRRPYRERVPHGPGAQEARAAKRARAFPAAAEAPPPPGAPTFLELQSVSPKAAQDYQTYVTAFYQWGQERHLLSDIATSLRSAPAIDLALVTYMNEKFFAGELSYVPTKLIAGLRYFWTYPNGAPLELPRSFRALTGWKRMVPAQSRLPYPWVALCLRVQHMIAAGQVMEALASIITFTLYLRPSECLRLQGKLITAPAQAPRRVQDGQGQMWPLLLHPQEGGATSKTGRVDESLLADNPLFPWLPQALGLLKAKFPHSLVFNFGQAQWGRALKGAAPACGLTALGDPDRSLARYERGGRINEQLSLLSQDILIAADLAASNIGVTLVSAGHPVFEIDMRHGVEHDMCSKALVKLIRGWVRGGLVTAAFMGTLPASWGRAVLRPRGCAAAPGRGEPAAQGRADAGELEGRAGPAGLARKQPPHAGHVAPGGKESMGCGEVGGLIAVAAEALSLASKAPVAHVREEGADTVGQGATPSPLFALPLAGKSLMDLAREEPEMALVQALATPEALSAAPASLWVQSGSPLGGELAAMTERLARVPSAQRSPLARGGVGSRPRAPAPHFGQGGCFGGRTWPGGPATGSPPSRRRQLWQELGGHDDTLSPAGGSAAARKRNREAVPFAHRVAELMEDLRAVGLASRVLAAWRCEALATRAASQGLHGGIPVMMLKRAVIFGWAALCRCKHLIKGAMDARRQMMRSQTATGGGAEAALSARSGAGALWSSKRLQSLAVERALLFAGRTVRRPGCDQRWAFLRAWRLESLSSQKERHAGRCRSLRSSCLRAVVASAARRAEADLRAAVAVWRLGCAVERREQRELQRLAAQREASAERDRHVRLRALFAAWRRQAARGRVGFLQRFLTEISGAAVRSQAIHLASLALVTWQGHGLASRLCYETGRRAELERRAERLASQAAFGASKAVAALAGHSAYSTLREALWGWRHQVAEQRQGERLSDALERSCVALEGGRRRGLQGWVLAAWQEARKLDRGRRQQRGLLELLLAERREAALTSALSEWRLLTLQDRHGRDKEDWMEHADGRLQQADRLLLVCQRDLPLRAALAAWSGAAAIERRDRERERWAGQAEARLQQAAALLALVQHDAPRYVVLVAWREAAAAASSGREKGRCMRQEADRRLRQADLLLLHCQQGEPRRPILEAWRGVVASERHGQEKSRLTYRADRRLQQAAAALAAHSRVAAHQVAFAAWREVAAAARQEREGERRVRQADLLLQMCQQDVPLRLTLEAWRSVATCGRHGREKDNLVLQCGRRLQQADAVLSFDMRLMVQRTAFAPWRNIAVAARLELDQQRLTSARLHQAELILQMGQKDLSLRETFEAWKGVVTSSRHGREKGHLMHEASKRLQVADVLLSGSMRMELYRMAFAAWKDLAVAAHHDSYKQQMRRCTEVRLHQADLLLQMGQQGVPLVVTVQAWRSLAASERHRREKEHLTHESSKHLQQTDGVLSIDMRMSQYRLAFTAWKDFAVAVHLELERTEQLQKSAEAWVGGNHADKLLQMCQQDVPSRLIFEAWRGAAAVERHGRETARLTDQASRHLQQTEAVVLIDMRMAQQRVTFVAWKDVAVAAHHELEKIDQLRRSADVRLHQADQLLQMCQQDVPSRVIFEAWRGAAAVERHGREKGHLMGQACRRLQLADAALATDGRVGRLCETFSAWKGVAVASHHEIEKRHQVQRSADQRLRQADLLLQIHQPEWSSRVMPGGAQRRSSGISVRGSA